MVCTYCGFIAVSVQKSKWSVIFFPSLVFPSFSKTKHTTKYKYCDQLSKTVTGVLDFQKAFMKREGKKWGSLCFMTFSVTSFFIFSIFCRAHGDSSRRRKIENRTAMYNVPNHWSSMPPDGQYIRVMLTTSSKEYKEVEQLFRKSMNDHISIERIERVQNPFMWEKYCRWEGKQNLEENVWKCIKWEQKVIQP